MNKNSVFSKTEKGAAALGWGKLLLARQKKRLLGMVDGRSSLAELCEESGLSQDVAEALLSGMLAEGLVKLQFAGHEVSAVQASSDDSIAVTELDPEEGLRAWAEAQRGTKALREEGFFAHKIHPMQERKGRPKILSVEDDLFIAHLLTALLTEEGFDVRHAADGAAAFHMLEEEMPDMVILDVMLPDTTGFKILEWIRKHPQLTSLPAIMLTAQVGEEDVMHGLRAGADGYIFKPFKPEPLLQCIRDVLKL